MTLYLEGLYFVWHMHSVNSAETYFDSTVVDLSTRPAFIIIFHFFQIQIFMVLQQAFSYKKIFFKE